MKKNHYLLFIFCFLLGSVLLWGCGGGSPGSPGSKGDLGTNVTITEVTHDYLDEDIQWQVDIVQDICTGGTPEDFSDDFAVFSFESTPLNPNSTRTPGNIHVGKYTVEFFPMTLGAPPIEKLEAGGSGYMFTIPGNGTIADIEILVLDVGRKVETSNAIIQGLYTPQRIPVQYDMWITFSGQNDYGEDFRLQWHTPILLADYDNC